MNVNYLEKLEYIKIKEKLSTFCITNYGKELCVSLLPCFEKENVKLKLQETNEATNLISRAKTPSFYIIDDINKDISLIKNGSFLTLKSLLNLNKLLKCAENLKSYFNVDYLETNEFPILSNLFDSLYTNKGIIDTISSSIIDEENLDDNASSQLASLRRQKRNLEQSIRTKLNTILHTSSKYIQEPIITIRNDRFVIPVKDEYRANVKGFIHDVSNGGSTVFIEPTAIFEINNELTKIKSLEELEIEKILYTLTSLFEPYINELSENYALIGKLDFIFGKAKYSNFLNATSPVISDKKEINLINAKHPLIPSANVVPISLNLGNTFSTLLITGPNTGGKTVTLKTVGLLCLMAYSGLNIPTSQKSSIYVFDNVFADIGDDQSIANSLSTFSSHMLNIIDILEHISKDSLVLVDELGSGTDPLEGANLAISILEHIKSIGALTIATTHYQELKKYALANSDFENASVEFDVNTLSPTYRLLIGIPGKSNAFAISKKLGLDDNIITRAKSLLSNDELHFEEVLKNIYDDKVTIQNEKIEIEKELNQISNLRKKLQTDFTSLESKKLDIINKARTEARNILLDAKNEASDIIKELNTVSDKSAGERLRNRLNDNIKDLSTQSTTNTESSSQNVQEDDLTINTEVYITTLNKNGIIISKVSRNKEVQVQIGIMKMNIPIKNLQLLNANNNNNNKKTILTSNKKHSFEAKSISNELNVIGYNSEDANYAVNKFIDTSILSHLGTVRIVHGKGTGILKNSIHSLLKTHPNVKSYRLGLYGEGESGVTVVELK